MSASNIEKEYILQYNANLVAALQQMESKFESAVMSGVHKGTKAATVDRMGDIEMQEILGRYSPMIRVDGDFVRRWVIPKGFELPQLIDDYDKLQMLADPKAIYTQSALYAARRKKDALINAAFFGDATTGENGDATTSFDSTNNVVLQTVGSASTASALNVKKIEAAKIILEENYVDFDTESVFIAINSFQHDQLRNDAKAMDTKYNGAFGIRFNEKGDLSSILGINIVKYQNLSSDGTYTRVPVWVKSGMHFGVWGDISTTVSQRNDLSGEPTQIYSKALWGATRLDEKKVIEIKCKAS